MTMVKPNVLWGDKKLINQRDAGAGWWVHWGKLIQRIKLVRNHDDAALLMQSLASVTKPTVIAFANAHTFNEACRPDFALTINQADIVLRDGVGVSSLFRLVGKQSGLNMNGTDWIPKILEYLAPERLALFGTEERFASLAAHSLSTTLPTAAYISVADGFKAVEHYIKIVREQRSNVVVLGMGVPRQEKIGCTIAQSIDFPCVIICGGAILDFLGGRVKRAPAWIRVVRSEWVYRLLLEPRRLFRRYVIGVPMFCARALLFSMYRIFMRTAIPHNRA